MIHKYKSYRPPHVTARARRLQQLRPAHMPNPLAPRCGPGVRSLRVGGQGERVKLIGVGIKGASREASDESVESEASAKLLHTASD